MSSKLSFIVGLYLICCIWLYVDTMLVVPSRANITDQYVLMNVRRTGRRSPYYVNVWGETLLTLGNGLKMDIIFSEYLHNEYRRSFVEFHYKLCDLVNNEPYIGRTLKNNNFTCPLPPGNHRFMKLKAPTENFPNVFPFTKGRLDFTITVIATKEMVLQAFVEATFVQ